MGLLTAGRKRPGDHYLHMWTMPMIRPISTCHTFDVLVMLRWFLTLFIHTLQEEIPYDIEVLMALIMKTACHMGCDDMQYDISVPNQCTIYGWKMSNVMKLHQHC